MKIKSKQSTEVPEPDKGKNSKQSGNHLGLVEESQGSDKNTAYTKEIKKQSVEVLDQCLGGGFYSRNGEHKHHYEPAPKRQCSEAGPADRQTAKKSQGKHRVQAYTNHQSQYNNYVAEQQRLRKMRLA